jgi:hypothetical protein
MLNGKSALNAKMNVNSSTHKRLDGGCQHTTWKGTLIAENKLVSSMLVF